MLGSVLLKTLRDSRRGLVGWSLGVVALVLVEAAVWPSMSSMGDLGQIYDAFPEQLRKLFNVEAMSTGTVFMNAELFTLMLPLLFIVRGIGLGARAVAGEEEHGTLDLLLVTPLSGTRLVAEKAVAMAVELMLLAVVLLGSVLVVSPWFDLGIGVADAAAGGLSSLLLGLEFGALALAVGTFTGHRGVAVAVASLAAVGAYVLYALGLMVDSLAGWRPLSPFDQALHGGPLGGGFPASFLWLVLGAVLLVAVSLPVLDRRDVTAPG
jgi:ABC-2 type transport system permease protein